jgi:hypothetical protein
LREWLQILFQECDVTSNKNSKTSPSLWSSSVFVNCTIIDEVRFIVLCEPGFRQANMGFAGVIMQFKVAKLIANAVTNPP